MLGQLWGLFNNSGECPRMNIWLAHVYLGVNWALLDQYLKSHLRYERYTKMAVSIAGLLVKQTEIGHEISEIFEQKQDLPFLVKSSL